MTDFHHNIFYYYRGTQRPNQGDHDRQLENNTTKALINVLEHCAPVVATKFLEWLGVVGTGCIEFELQRKTISKGELKNKEQHLFLGIVQLKDNNSSVDQKKPGSAPKDEASVPDAWIYGDDFVILIESKVEGDLIQAQVERHLSLLKPNPVQLKKTWAEIHQFFRNLSAVLIDEKDEWIVGQFTQYLEYWGLAEFAGFIPDMFDYFKAHDDDDVRLIIRSTISSFAKKVLARLKLRNQIDYVDYHLGNLSLKDSSCWVAFSDSGENFGNRAHQTISVCARGLDIFVNVELKPAADRLKRKIRDDNEGFRNAINNLPKPFTVCIEEREYERPRYFRYRRVVEIESGRLKESSEFEFIERRLNEIKFPNFMVVRHIPKEDALELSKQGGDALIDRTTNIMETLHPLVKFINT